MSKKMAACLNNSEYGSMSKKEKEKYMKFANVLLGCMDYKKTLEMNKNTHTFRIGTRKKTPRKVTVALKTTPRRQAAAETTDTETFSARKTPQLRARASVATGKKTPQQQAAKETNTGTVAKRRTVRREAPVSVAPELQVAKETDTGPVATRTKGLVRRPVSVAPEQQVATETDTGPVAARTRGLFRRQTSVSIAPERQSAIETDIGAVATRISVRQQDSVSVAPERQSANETDIETNAASKSPQRQPATGTEAANKTGTETGAEAPPNTVDLLVEDVVSCVVAKGHVLVGGGPLVHSMARSQDCSTVSVVEVLDGEAMLPRPTSEFTMVGDAKNSFLQWPKELIGNASTAAPTTSTAAPTTSTAAMGLCELSVKEKRTRLVAKGIVQEGDWEELVKVLVEEVRDAQAPVPNPTEDVINVGQASGKVVEWPRRLTKATTNKAVESDISNSGFGLGDGGLDNQSTEEDSFGGKSGPENTAARVSAGAATRRRTAAAAGLTKKEQFNWRVMTKNITSGNQAIEKAKCDILGEPEFRRVLEVIALLFSMINDLPSQDCVLNIGSWIQLSRRWVKENFGIDSEVEEFETLIDNVVEFLRSYDVGFEITTDGSCFIASMINRTDELKENRDFRTKRFELLKMVYQSKEDEAVLKEFEEKHNL